MSYREITIFLEMYWYSKFLMIFRDYIEWVCVFTSGIWIDGDDRGIVEVIVKVDLFYIWVLFVLCFWFLFIVGIFVYWYWLFFIFRGFRFRLDDLFFFFFRLLIILRYMVVVYVFWVFVYNIGEFKRIGVFIFCIEYR